MNYPVSPDILIRHAKPSETPLILQFIRELAEYEGMVSQVTATEKGLRKTIFEDHRAQVLFSEYRGTVVGFALYFYNYSTFLGKPGLYLEDIYVREPWRSKGIGRAFFRTFAQIAKAEDCGRIEWWCLDWNQKSIDFYLGLGAEPMKDWTVYRLTEEQFGKIIGDSIV